MARAPMIRRILSVDFETASAQRASACSMGLCLLDYEIGVVIEKKHFLINPEVEFCKRNIGIHGITPDMVEGSPTFPQIIDEFTSLLDNSTIVTSHNAPFDISVILRSCIRYNIAPPDFCYYCTLAYSKALLPGLSSYTLDAISSHLGLSSFDHHKADDDAEACAIIFYNLIHPLGLQTISSIDRHTRIRHKNSLDKYKEIQREQHQTPSSDRIGTISISINLQEKIRREEKRFSPAISIVQPSISESALRESPFFGMHVVFTGGLQTFSRSEAQNAVLEAGGLIGGDVVSCTDIIVCGDGYVSGTPFRTQSRKISKAKSFISKGKKMTFIDESEFISMLTDFEIIKDAHSRCE